MTRPKYRQSKAVGISANAGKPRMRKINAAPAGAEKPVATPAGFPIVGIGASAGGLAAFEAFFSGMPAIGDPGMAFILVQHLAPDHKSILTDLIRRYTRMQVFEVEDGMEVAPNCAYIIPPGRDMAFLNGALQLLEPSAPRGQRLPIDFFFRSLALDQHERAIGIVLSGTGSDGTSGVRAIKGEGGMVMAQNPASTEYDGMPRSAIATGLVDFELPPAEMPAQLIAYATHSISQPFMAIPPTPKAENALKKILILLRSQTGHDFSQYKPSTIRRRIERRMAVHQIETLDDYVKYQQATPTETEALFRDMLIGVTSFFRDPGAFAALEEQVIPRLFADRPTGATIRVWTPGCSTGEEAYSLAILLHERMEAHRLSFKLQVFATDIDSQAVATARIGIYPASIGIDLTPERLTRFFAPEPGGGDGNPTAYRIHKNIRDLLVFSEQDVIKDPPFSRLDLISCRNLMIYMSSELQKKLLPLFHYALDPGGFLFLGNSETVGEHVDLFSVQDRKAKIYQRMEDFHGLQRTTPSRFLPPVTGAMEMTPLARPPARTAAPAKLPLRELTETALLQEVVPSGALVTAGGDILYLHGRTGLYLEPAPGEVGVSNILKMAREGLKHILTTALHKAAGNMETVRYTGLRVKTNGSFSTVSLTVRPVDSVPASLARDTPAAAAGTPLFLVILQDVPESEAAIRNTDVVESGGNDVMDVNSRIAKLKQELHTRDEYLQTANEELETSNEELKSSNEEMQSVNEELQSTNEELETSKEELQSVNEELATVNAELQSKVADLSRANNDMNNLLAGTGIATVFVDHQLRIMRFTPAATRLINLILTDVGRPVGHIVSNLTGYDHLAMDAQAVLDTLIPHEKQVRTSDGRWYAMRIFPYRTLDNVIEGAVITFVDITELMKTQAAMQASDKFLRESQRIAHIGSWRLDAATNQVVWSEELYKMFGFDPSLPPPPYDEHRKLFTAESWERLSTTLATTMKTGIPYTLELETIKKDGSKGWICVQGQTDVDATGKTVALWGAAQDITARRQEDEARRTFNQKCAILYELSTEAHVIIEITEDGRERGFIDCNQAALDLLGMTRDQLLAADAVSLSPERQPDGRLSIEKARELTARCLSEGSLRFDWVHCRADGKPFPVEITRVVYHEQERTFLHSVWRDLTQLTHATAAENALRNSPPPEERK